MKLKQRKNVSIATGVTLALTLVGCDSNNVSTGTSAISGPAGGSVPVSGPVSGTGSASGRGKPTIIQDSPFYLSTLAPSPRLYGFLRNTGNAGAVAIKVSCRFYDTASALVFSNYTYFDGKQRVHAEHRRYNSQRTLPR